MMATWSLTSWARAKFLSSSAWALSFTTMPAASQGFCSWSPLLASPAVMTCKDQSAPYPPPSPLPLPSACTGVRSNVIIAAGSCLAAILIQCQGEGDPQGDVRGALARGPARRGPLCWLGESSIKTLLPAALVLFFGLALPFCMLTFHLPAGLRSEEESSEPAA